jgi:hypothetical protein
MHHVLTGATSDFIYQTCAWQGHAQNLSNCSFVSFCWRTFEQSATTDATILTKNL